MRVFIRSLALFSFLILCVGCEKIDGGGKEVNIFVLNPPEEYDALMQALKDGTGQSASFLWFSDVHFSRTNLRRILSWYKRYNTCFDDIIATGDQQNLYYTDDFSWWSNCGASNVLQAVGNHDAWISESIYKGKKYEGETVRTYGKESQFYILSQKDVYNKLFSPFISSWEVIQPESGKCYYYKDYGKLRLVVVDCMHYGTVDDLDENKKSLQDKWLKDVLNDARKNGLAVMIASHYPPANASLIPCSYTNKKSNGQYSDRLNRLAAKDVSRFLDAGGEFVGWLTGHSHYDDIGVLELDSRQLLLRCATANHNRSKEKLRVNGKQNQDSFNCFSVDTDIKEIYLVKVGADVNADGERKRILRYRYQDYTDAAGNVYERGLICSE